MPRTVALIVAAGSGKRFGAPLPKQYANLAGQPVLTRTVEAFVSHPGIESICVVYAEGCEEDYRTAVQDLPQDRLLTPVVGGKTRQASVRNGLEALVALKPDLVLIHDGARPFASEQLITDCINGLQSSQGVFAAIPVTDTLRRISDGATQTIDRENLWRASTPQGFHFEAILQAHRAAVSDTATDDVAVAEAAGLSIAPIEDSADNFKITTREDLQMAEAKLGRQAPAMITRTGLGYDVHRFERGRPMILCGIHLADSQLGLKGHSDADVALHALTDALLGAVGAGDIGEHFPPSDDKWKGAPSHIFVAGAMEEIAKRGGTFINADITIICEVPKINPIRAAMRTRVAELLGCREDAVNIKATTTEGLGFTGREEGVAAQAVVSVALPFQGE